MCPLVEAKSESAACRTHMLTRKSIWNVETTYVNATVSIGHGHVVFVADVRTKSHRTRLTIGLFHLDVDLLMKGHDLRPTIGRQRDVFGRRDRRCYLHLTRHNVEHTMLLTAKSERRTRRQLSLLPTRQLDTPLWRSPSSCLLLATGRRHSQSSVFV